MLHPNPFVAMDHSEDSPGPFYHVCQENRAPFGRPAPGLRTGFTPVLWPCYPLCLLTYAYVYTHVIVYICICIHIHAGVYFVHLHENIHRRKSTEALLLGLSLQNLHRPNTVKFPEKRHMVLLAVASREFRKRH